jgi:hypothetical protein
MSLVYYGYADKTTLPPDVKLAACAALAVGIVMQSGGFFWHAFLDKNGATTGLRITRIGALLLAAAVLVLAYALVTA